MALSEKLQYILTLNSAGAVAGFQKVGQTAETELGKAETKLDKIGSGLSKFGAGAVAFAGVAGAALVSFGNAASDLAESVNAVNVTFGDAAEGIKTLGEEAATAVGLSETEFNGLAVQFSNFAQTVAGGTGESVVQVMDDLTTRAADFASVMNIDVKQAAELFQSGLAGETEPLRQYGIDLSAAAVEAHALATGIHDGSGEMSEQQKVMSRYSLLMQQTSKVQGDFANTADSAANKQRVLSAQWKNLQADIGEGVLPAMQQVIGILQSATEWFNGLSDGTKAAIGSFAVFGTAAAATVGAISLVVGQIIKMRDSLSNAATWFSDLSSGAKGATLALGAAALAAAAGFAAYQAFTAKEREIQEVTEAATDQLYAQIDAFYATEDAANSVNPALEGIARAMALNGDNGEKLTEALGSMNLSLEDAGPLLVSLKQGGDQAVDTLARMAESAGLSSAEAQNLAEIVNATDEQLNDSNRIWNDFTNQWEDLPAHMVPVARAMEEIQDQVEKTDMSKMIADTINLAIANEDLTPAVVKAAEAQAGTTRTAEDNFKVWAALTPVLKEGTKAHVDQAVAVQANAGAQKDASEAAAELAARQKEVAEAFDESIEAIDGQIDKLEATKTAIEDNIGLLEGQLEAQQGLADATYSLHDAEDAFVESLGAANDELSDGDDNWRENRSALEDVATAAQSVADGWVRIREEEATARGETLSATEALDIQNHVLLTQADTLEGESRQALLNHIGLVNNIKPEVVTEIDTLLREGKFAEAEEKLKGLSKTRETAVEIKIAKQSLEQLGRVILDATRKRELIVEAKAVTQEASERLKEDIPDELVATVQTAINQGKFGKVKGLLEAMEKGPWQPVFEALSDLVGTRRALELLEDGPWEPTITGIPNMGHAESVANETARDRDSDMTQVPHTANAEREANETARNRDTFIDVDSDAESEGGDIDYAARPRTSYVDVVVNTIENVTRNVSEVLNPFGHVGRHIEPGQAYTVGRPGAEETLVMDGPMGVSGHGQLYSTEDTERMRGGAAGRGGGPTYNLHVHNEMSSADVAQAFRILELQS